MVYRIVKFFLRRVVMPIYRFEVVGIEKLDAIDGPVIVAPVHRSNLDAALAGAMMNKRLRALAKESLFDKRPFGWLCAALGAFPVKRGEADRESLMVALRILERGEALLVFPEGTRQSGDQVAEVYTGPAFLAARTGAPIVPVGIAGTEAALPSGAKFLKRSVIRVVIGDPIHVSKGRMSKDQRNELTAQLAEELQAAQDKALTLLPASQ